MKKIGQYINTHFFETSKLVLMLKFTRERYSHMDAYLDNYCKDSRGHHLINKVIIKMNNLFKYSFLEKISRIRQDDNSRSLIDSAVVTCWIDWLKTKKRLLFEFGKTSRIMISTKEAGQAAYREPIKTLSIILSSAILVDIFLCLLFKKEISLLGWVMRGVFLFIVAGGFFCNVDWQSIEDGSIFFKKIIKK